MIPNGLINCGAFYWLTKQEIWKHSRLGIRLWLLNKKLTQLTFICSIAVTWLELFLRKIFVKGWCISRLLLSKNCVRLLLNIL